MLPSRANHLDDIVDELLGETDFDDGLAHFGQNRRICHRQKAEILDQTPAPR